jgi:hypothetical protein
MDSSIFDCAQLSGVTMIKASSIENFCITSSYIF